MKRMVPEGTVLGASPLPCTPFSMTSVQITDAADNKASRSRAGFPRLCVSDICHDEEKPSYKLSRVQPAGCS